MRPSRHAIAIAALFSAILIHGCSDDAPAETTGGGDATTVRFASPLNNAEISAAGTSADIEASFEVTNAEGLTIHCSIDGEEVGTATDNAYTYEGVEEGQHTLSAELRDADGAVQGEGEDISITVLSGLSCESVSDCNDDDDCTLDACDGGLCAYFDAGGDGCDGTFDSPICKDNDDCDKFIEGAGACAYAQCGEDKLCAVGVHEDGYVCAEGGCGASSTCDAGECVTGEATDCDDGDPCTDDSCDEETGACVNAPTDCDDGNPCTENSCGEEGCIATPVDGDCDDGSACTTGDTCVDGTCTGEAVVCESTDPCVASQCDPESGDCVDSGESCDDGNPCTDDACDEEGNCGYTNNEGACDDGSLCTTDGQCSEGTCVGGTLIDCNDDNACSFDECDEATGDCVNSFPDCNDDIDCTTDSCDATTGACVNEPAEGCCATSAECGDDTCNPVECVDNACVDGAPLCGNGELDGACGETCDDGNTDDGDGCSSACQAEGCGSDEECGGDACNTGVCNLADGTCSLEPKTGEVCDDGLFCTENDACTSAGACEGSAVSCNDAIFCTDDSCDEAGGACVNAPNAAACGDSTACQGWICNTQLGCQEDNIIGGCDDGDPCTLSDNCANGLCIGQGQKSCVDGNTCTVDNVCVSGVGCDFSQVALNQPCDDGDPCTVDSACQQNGSCGGGDDSGVCAEQPVCVFNGGAGEVSCTLDLAHAETGLLDSYLTTAAGTQFKLSFDPGTLQFQGFFKDFNGFDIPANGSLSSGHTISTLPSTPAEISSSGTANVIIAHFTQPNTPLSTAFKSGNSIVGPSDFVTLKFTKTASGQATLYMSDLTCTNGPGTALSSGVEDEVILIYP